MTAAATTPVQPSAAAAPGYRRALTLLALAVLGAGSAFLASAAAGARTAMVAAQPPGLPGGPSGPVFPPPSCALARLAVPTALWIWKAVVVAAALGCSAVLAGAAQRRGLSGARAAALFGLNPVVFVFGIGGAHNDLLLVLLVAGAIALALAGRTAVGGA